LIEVTSFTEPEMQKHRIKGESTENLLTSSRDLYLLLKESQKKKESAKPYIGKLVLHQFYNIKLKLIKRFH